MSVYPIDLQTLFSHLDIAAQDHAHQRDAVIKAQGIIGQHVAAKSVEHDHAVFASTASDQILHINDDEATEGEQRSEKRHQQKKKHAQREDIHDPLCGSRIDLIR